MTKQEETKDLEERKNRRDELMRVLLALGNTRKVKEQKHEEWLRLKYGPRGKVKLTPPTPEEEERMKALEKEIAEAEKTIKKLCAEKDALLKEGRRRR